MIRLAVRVRREDADVALADLLELAPAGVEEVELPDADVVEYAVYGAPGELPALPDLRAAAGDALVEVRTSEVADDWAERWRAVAATGATAAARGVGVGARRWDLRAEPLPDAPVVLANLVRSLLLTLAERMVAPPRVLVAGGLLAHEADEVAQAFTLRHGLRE